MMTHIYRQFERPHGALGALAGFVMSHRPSNKERNRWTVDLIAAERDARVLEIGCGPGLALPRYATVSPSAASSDWIIRR
jgi:hypothetical protein